MRIQIKLLMIFLILIAGISYGQGITFTFENETITTDGPNKYLEYDVYVEATALSYIGDCQAFVIYNTDAFGSNIKAGGGLTVTKGSLVDDETSGTPHYLIIVNDNGANVDRFSIAIEFDVFTPATLSTTPEQWAHVKMKITNTAETSGLGFWAVQMVGIQYYKVPDGSYDPVTATDTYDVSLPVQMAGMSAVAVEGEGVTVQWETQSEVNSLGFHVWRSEESPSNYAKITSDIIASQGNGSSLIEYAYTDNHVTPNTMYWYKVEEISTSGASIFYGPISVQGVSAFPTTYAMSQNYPNPFNPETSFSIDVPQDGQVTIRVYSLLGQEVKTLLNESLDAGRFDMSWNGNNDNGFSMPSGMYFLKMNAGSFQQVRKITLIR
ncbi:T9SS type A sorting domain-containing protein [candidate division KSB1 bacterium]|nr:T9SS type A sorting domain-containing protein [candidate division KSB1 bacterium]